MRRAKTLLSPWLEVNGVMEIMGMMEMMGIMEMMGKWKDGGQNEIKEC